MTNGYIGTFLFVNLSDGTLRSESADEAIFRKFIGGYGVGARILYDGMPKGVDPLGPDNILGFVTGPITGTDAQISSRFTVVAKSPLTGTWGDANSGGFFGPMMKKSGFDAIFFIGISPFPVYLLIQNGQAIIRRADDLWGKDTFETEDKLKGEHGSKAEIACIGPAGEKLSLISGICCNKGRLAARSGLGAVMGTKKLKALVALGGVSIIVAHPQQLKEIREEYIKTQCLFADLYKSTGTPGLVEGAAYTGDLPTRNWRSTTPLENIEIRNINGDAVLSKQIRRWGCYKCSVACGGVISGVYSDLASQNIHSHKPEYETIAALGPLCLNDDLLSIIKGNDLCNRYGIDTISAGGVVAFAMDLFERGIISQESCGLDLTWGNADSILRLLEMIGNREGLGDILADGVRVASAKIGRGSEQFAIHIQGQELPMHDPKVYPGMAPAYHLDDAPARHMHNNGWLITAPQEWLKEIGIANPDPVNYIGQGKNFMIISAHSHFMNAAGFCILGWLSNSSLYMYRFMEAVTGWKCDKDEVLSAGERIANMRHIFNLREGHNPRRWKYPSIMIGDPPFISGPLKNVILDTETLEREWLQAYNWDVETTMPDPTRLKALGLPELAIEIETGFKGVY